MAEQTLATPAKKWAREYETIYILEPNVATEDAERVAKRVQDVMDRLNGKLTKVDNWGKRKLAYPIRKFGRGIFIYLKFVAMNDVVAELERNLGISDPVMRFQTVLLRDRLELSDVAVNAEETAFAAIEQTGEEEVELTAAERLGMVERQRSAPVVEDAYDMDEDGLDDEDAMEDADA